MCEGIELFSIMNNSCMCGGHGREGFAYCWHSGPDFWYFALVLAVLQVMCLCVVGLVLLVGHE